MIIHPIKPLYDENSALLILGSFPSVKSREAGFYYGNPQNRFWRVLAAVYGEETPESTEEKKRFLHSHNIALFDVIKSCEITGSSDGSIKDVRPNDISAIIKKTKIKKIFLNGKTAERYYKKYNSDKINLPAVCLPSTSPANAAWSGEKLIQAWKEIRD